MTGNMGNCLPCLPRKEVDRRSARQSYFDAKRREKEVMAYTGSEYKKEKNNRPFTLKFRAPAPKKQQ